MSVVNIKHKKILSEKLFFDERNLLATVLSTVENI